MMRAPLAMLMLAAALAGCTETVAPGGTAGTPPLLAQGRDTGVTDRRPLIQQTASVAVDPDGCQNWIFDDGAEGYASRRRDPVSGLPVCGHGTPGYVYRDPRFTGFPDVLPN
jgi:hypothetical protein